MLGNNNNDNNKKNPHLNFLRRNVTAGLDFSIQTLLTKRRFGDKYNGDICQCNICPGDNCHIFLERLVLHAWNLKYRFTSQNEGLEVQEIL